MTANSYKILQYLQKHNKATAVEVAQATDIQKRLVDSYFSAAIVKAGLGNRETIGDSICLVLNSKGMAYTE